MVHDTCLSSQPYKVGSADRRIPKGQEWANMAYVAKCQANEKPCLKKCKVLRTTVIGVLLFAQYNTYMCTHHKHHMNQSTHMYTSIHQSTYMCTYIHQSTHICTHLNTGRKRERTRKEKAGQHIQLRDLGVQFCAFHVLSPEFIPQ